MKKFKLLILIDKHTDKVILLSKLALCIYIPSMFVYPFVIGGWNLLDRTLSEWQTLNAGVIAYLAAVLVFASSRAETLKAADRARLAARSYLAISILEAYQYVDGCSRIIDKAMKLGKLESYSFEFSAMPDFPFPPPIPENSLKGLLDVANTTESRQVADFISLIFKNFQVYDSRIRSLTYAMRGEDDELYSRRAFNALIYDTAIIRSYLDAILQYVRDGSIEIQTNYDVKLAIMVLPIDYNARQSAHGDAVKRGLLDIHII